MLRYIVRALVDRSRESTVLFLLAALISGIVAASPWYLVGRAQDVAGADLVAAPAASTVVSAERLTTSAEDLPKALADADATVAKALPLPGTDRIAGMQGNALLTTTTTTAPVNVQLVLRGGACEKLLVEGQCPRVPGEVMISADLAAELGLAPGGHLLLTATSSHPRVSETIAGTYRFRDPGDRYWAGRYQDVLERSRIVFAAEPGDYRVIGSGQSRIVVDIVPEPGIFAEHEVNEILDVFRAASLRGGNLEYRTPLWRLAGEIGDQQIDLATAIVVATVEVLIFGWLVLFLVLRQLGWQHRMELGTLKLRGVGGPRSLAVTLGRHALTLAGGGVVGAVAGMLLARSGLDHIVPRYSMFAAISTAAALGVVVVGALIAALIAERRNFASDVTHLLRSVPRRVRGTGLIGLEAGVVVAAAAAVYLVHGGGEILGPLVPLLIAFASGIVVAEIVTWWLGRAGRRRIRRGLLPSAVAALWHARRPGLLRASALLTVAVAMAAISTSVAAGTIAAQRERAARTLGAESVLTVRAASNATLLSAVRDADPSGTAAMAVVRNPSGHVIAVDSARLGAVATWPTGEGSALPGDLARLLIPSGLRQLPAVTGPAMTATVSRDDDVDVPVWLAYELVDGAGAAVRGLLGPIPAHGAPTLTGPALSCVDPCRLRSLGLVGDGGGSKTASRSAVSASVEPTAVARGGVRLKISRLSVDADLTDRVLWRTGVAGEPARPLEVGADAAGLTLTVPSGVSSVAPYVYPDPGIARVPVVAAGSWAPASAAAELPLLPGVVALCHQVGWVDTVPGDTGPAALVDLDLADRFGSGIVGAEVQEVWLSGAVTAGLRDRLADRGVRIIGERSVPVLSGQLSQQAAPVTARYHAVVWWLAVVISAMALLVLLVGEETELIAALAALRQQGLTRRRVRAAGARTYAWVLGTSLGTGLIAAAAALSPLLPVRRYFDDDWAPLPGGPPIGPAGVAVALAVVLLLLTGVCLIAGRRLMRRVGA